MTALSLLSLLLVSATPQDYAQPAPADPAVRVWTDADEGYAGGDLARVYVRAQSDGYLVVLHADPYGTVRVLFPVDPVDDDFVRGGQSLEVRGRGDREAFLIDEGSGTGIVLAAWSRDPFRFDGLVRGDHWDYRMMAPEGLRGDAEAGLLDIAHTMAAGRDFEYDAAPYFVRATPRQTTSRVAVSVGTHVDRCAGCYGPRIRPRSGFSLNISFGSFGYDPWRHYSRYYDPYYHFGSPGWSWWAYHYRPFPVWHHHRSVWVYDPFIWYRVPRYHYPHIGIRVRYAGGSCWGSPFCYRDRYPRSRPGIATGIALAGDFGRGVSDGIGWGGGRLTGGDRIGDAGGIATGRTATGRTATGRVGTTFDGSATGRIGGTSTGRSATARIGGSTADRGATGRSGGSSSDRGATGRIGGSSSDRSATGRIGGSSSDRGATGRIGGSSSDRGATGSIGGAIIDRGSRDRAGSSSSDRRATGRIGGSSSDRGATGSIGGAIIDRASRDRAGSSSSDRRATGRIGGSSSDRGATGSIGGSSIDRGSRDRAGSSSSDRRATGRIGGSTSNSSRIIVPSQSGRLRDSARPLPTRSTVRERPSGSRPGSISRTARPPRSAPPPSARSSTGRSGGSASASGRATSRGSSSGRSGGRIGGNL